MNNPNEYDNDFGERYPESPVDPINPLQPSGEDIPFPSEQPPAQSTPTYPAYDPSYQPAHETPPLHSQTGQTQTHAAGYSYATQPVQPAAQAYAEVPTEPAAHTYAEVPLHQPAHSHTQAPAHAQKKSSSGFKTFLLGFLGAALAVALGFGGFGLYQYFNPNTSSSVPATVLGSSDSTKIEINEDTTLPEAVAKKALPSVVNIDVYSEQSSYNFFGYGAPDGTLTESSLGSGVILSKDGYIVTNYHVIEGAAKLEATVGDTTYEATIVGTDPSSDIAVIKIEGAQDLTPIELGSSANLEIGQWVMTIGSPFGLEQSVATGIVSATSRSQILESTTGSAMVYANLIQTDAAINPGNSGGALVDSNGKLIGVNTLITSYSGNYSGVGFAIPVDYAINIAQQIIDGEEPTHAQLGVSLSTVSDSVAKRYGLSTNAGAYVTQVYAGTGADEAGIEVGDIITKFNDKTVSTASDLMLDVRSLNPGDKVKLEVNREGKTMDVEVTLGSDAATTQSGSLKSK